jgi:hypothetical protein
MLTLTADSAVPNSFICDDDPKSLMMQNGLTKLAPKSGTIETYTGNDTIVNIGKIKTFQYSMTKTAISNLNLNHRTWMFLNSKEFFCVAETEGPEPLGMDRITTSSKRRYNSITKSPKNKKMRFRNPQKHDEQ